MSKLKGRYQNSKAAKVGAECTCPSCGEKFIKDNYQQAFCKTKGGTICKDYYWNNVTPTKRNNTTRISPANAAYLPVIARMNGYPDVQTMKHARSQSEGFNGEWDSHSCNASNCEWCGLKAEYCQCRCN
jgi:hypothetical protein